MGSYGQDKPTKVLSYSRDALLAIRNSISTSSLPAGVDEGFLRDLEEVGNEHEKRSGWAFPQPAASPFRTVKPTLQGQAPIRSRLVDDGTLNDDAPAVHERLNSGRSNNWRTESGSRSLDERGDHWGPQNRNRAVPPREREAERERERERLPERERERAVAERGREPDGRARRWDEGKANHDTWRHPPASPVRDDKWGQEKGERRPAAAPPRGPSRWEEPAGWDAKKRDFNHRDGADGYKRREYGEGGGRRGEPEWMDDGPARPASPPAGLQPRAAPPGRMSAAEFEKERQRQQETWRKEARAKTEEEDVDALLATMVDEDARGAENAPPPGGKSRWGFKLEHNEDALPPPPPEPPVQQPPGPPGEVHGVKMLFQQLALTASGPDPIQQPRPLPFVPPGNAVTLDELERSLHVKPVEQPPGVGVPGRGPLVVNNEASNLLKSVLKVAAPPPSNLPMQPGNGMASADPPPGAPGWTPPGGPPPGPPPPGFAPLPPPPPAGPLSALFSNLAPLPGSLPGSLPMTFPPNPPPMGELPGLPPFNPPPITPAPGISGPPGLAPPPAPFAPPVMPPPPTTSQPAEPQDPSLPPGLAPPPGLTAPATRPPGFTHPATVTAPPGLAPPSSSAPPAPPAEDKPPMSSLEMNTAVPQPPPPADDGAPTVPPGLPIPANMSNIPRTPSQGTFLEQLFASQPHLFTSQPQPSPMFNPSPASYPPPSAVPTSTFPFHSQAPPPPIATGPTPPASQPLMPSAGALAGANLLASLKSESDHNTMTNTAARPLPGVPGMPPTSTFANPSPPPHASTSAPLPHPAATPPMTSPFLLHSMDGTPSGPSTSSNIADSPLVPNLPNIITTPPATPAQTNTSPRLTLTPPSIGPQLAAGVAGLFSPDGVAPSGLESPSLQSVVSHLLDEPKLLMMDDSVVEPPKLQSKGSLGLKNDMLQGSKQPNSDGPQPMTGASFSSLQDNPLSSIWATSLTPRIPPISSSGFPTLAGSAGGSLLSQLSASSTRTLEAASPGSLLNKDNRPSAATPNALASFLNPNTSAAAPQPKPAGSMTADLSLLTSQLGAHSALGGIPTPSSSLGGVPAPSSLVGIPQTSTAEKRALHEQGMALLSQLLQKKGNQSNTPAPPSLSTNVSAQMHMSNLVQSHGGVNLQSLGQQPGIPGLSAQVSAQMQAQAQARLGMLGGVSAAMAMGGGMPPMSLAQNSSSLLRLPQSAQHTAQPQGQDMNGWLQGLLNRQQNPSVHSLPGGGTALDAASLSGLQAGLQSSLVRQQVSARPGVQSIMGQGAQGLQVPNMTPSGLGGVQLGGIPGQQLTGAGGLQSLQLQRVGNSFLQQQPGQTLTGAGALPAGYQNMQSSYAFGGRPPLQAGGLQISNQPGAVPGLVSQMQQLPMSQQPQYLQAGLGGQPSPQQPQYLQSGLGGQPSPAGTLSTAERLFATSQLSGIPQQLLPGAGGQRVLPSAQPQQPQMQMLSSLQGGVPAPGTWTGAGGWGK